MALRSHPAKGAHVALDFLEAARGTFPEKTDHSIALGAPVHDGICVAEPIVRIPLSMLNRHGLIAGATGTGKTKSLQLLAEQLSEAGVPVFLADVKGDLSGLGAVGEPYELVERRARETGWDWRPEASPIELLSLTGKRGAQLRATVSSFGPLLLAKVLELNTTQASVLTLVFKYADDRALELVDLADLRAVVQHLSGAGADDLREYGGISKATAGVLLRSLVELEQQGGVALFGEPQFRLEDLLRVDGEGRGVVSMLELTDVQDRPALFSTFMMWMLDRLYRELPEVGDVAKPKLVFFFDEAHLLFKQASPAFLEQIERVVRLIRSKGVGIFFVTQSPKDVPPAVLGQLGHKVQHALRAFTADDAAALKAAARTFPRTPFYDIEQTLQSLGIGEAFVTVLSPSGIPTPPLVVKLIPPASRMGPLSEVEIRSHLATSPLVARYGERLERTSAAERLAENIEETGVREKQGRPTKEPDSAFQQVLKSPMTKGVVGQVTRGIMAAIFGTKRRRR